MMRVLTLGLVAMVAACSSRSLKGDGGGLSGAGGSVADARDGRLPDAGVGGAGGSPPPSQREIYIPASASLDIDVVFVIDNSSATTAIQQKLVASFPEFTRSLAAPTGTLPNLHIAIVSSDLGAGVYDSDSISSCRRGGDQGIFRNAPLGTTCGTGALNIGEHFISTIAGQNNFLGTLEDAFACIAPLGDRGCGFEHPLGALLRALGADGNGGAPIENANFLRQKAMLAVVVVTNEDDCSAPINSTLFDPTSRYVTDPLGPLTSFSRCNDYGHLCDGKRPSLMAPADLSGTCHSAEDGRLLRVSDIAAALKGLKPDTGRVVLSVIAAPPSPYKTGLQPSTIPGDSSQWPAVARSCTAGDGTSGDPAVRLSELAQAFGPNGLFETLCADSFAPALQRIGDKVIHGVTPPCLDDKVVDADPQTPALEADCTAIADDDHGNMMPLARCLDASSAPCWEIISDPANCGARKRVAFHVGRAVGSPSTTLTCQICAPNDPRPGCQY